MRKPKFFTNTGPGVLIAAAFIGPGTVATAMRAGVEFGYDLLWALLLSFIATIVLQEMAGRLGLISQKGLAEAIRLQLSSPVVRFLVLTLILSAIGIGNTAYEAGNLSGAILGLEAIFGPGHFGIYLLVSGALAIALLWVGQQKTLERIFTFLVGVMSLSFLISALLTQPDLINIIKGLFVPKLNAQNVFLVVALIGTTVVPYNLFLHASLVKERWNSSGELTRMRKDIVLSVLIGGLISMAIVISAVALPAQEINGILDMAVGLEPLYGRAARYSIGIGLFAAGITSAITAPMAAAFVVMQCFGWNGGPASLRFRGIAILIILIGLLALTLEYKPLELIQFAQIANGLLLPVLGFLLIWIVNKKVVLGEFKNTIFQNILAIIIVVIITGLGYRSISSAF